MGRSVTSTSLYKPPTKLAKFFDNAPLIGDEKLEDYNLISSAITAAIAPKDVVSWLLTQDAVYWTWEIRRERAVKAAVISHHQRQVVFELLKSLMDSDGLAAATYRIFEADTEIRRWSNDPQAREEINERLTAAGHDLPSILAMAYVRGADDIDAVDRRIAAYEQRRNSALREAGYRNQYLFDQLKKVDSAIIDAEFSEAAE